MSHRVYVGTVGQGVFRSLDGGQSFRRAAEGMFVECDVRALAVHPRDDRTLVLGGRGLFLSRDGANTWSPLHDLGGQQVWSLLFHPDDPDRLLAGTCPGGIWRAGAGPASWVPTHHAVTADCPRIVHTRTTCLLADQAHPGRFLAGVEIDGLHASEDGGQSWARLGEGLSSADVHDLAWADGPDGRALLATTNRDLNRSLDGGRTWGVATITGAFPWSYCRALSPPLQAGQPLLLGAGDGPPGSEGAIGLSEDGGRTWAAARMPTRSNSTIWCFARHRADPGLVYAASVSGQLWRSHDAGASWARLPREFGEVRSLAWTP